MILNQKRRDQIQYRPISIVNMNIQLQKGKAHNQSKGSEQLEKERKGSSAILHYLD